MKRYILLLLCVCLALCGTFAQIDRTKAPASGPAPTVTIGEYQQFTLDNGLRVLVVENNKVPQVLFSLRFTNDPISEGDKAGYLDIAGELWGKATEKRSTKQLNEEVDFLGASLNSSASGISISGLSKFKEQLMDILSDVTLHPTFPQEEFDKLILQAKSGLQASKTDPSSIISNLESATLWGKGHPYSDIVTETTIDRVSVKDCKNYYDTYIHPSNAILVIVGDITLADAKNLTKTYLNNWKGGNAPRHDYAEPVQPKGIHVVFSNKDAAPQASINVIYPIDYRKGMGDEIALSIANQILGGGDFQAKLLKNLREDKGYTYGAYSRVSPSQLRSAGTFSASAEVKTNTADSAVTQILNEMQRMTAGNFTDEDLSRVKKTYAGAFSRSLESPATIAGFAYSVERFGLPKDYYTTYLQRLETTTMGDVIAASMKYFHPENAYILVVTDSGMKERMAALANDGEITELDYKGEPVKEAKAAAPGMTAEKVIEAYLEAIGGRAKVEAIKTMSISSEMAMQGLTIKTVNKYDLSGEKPKFSMEVSMMGNLMQKIDYDGEKAVVSGGGGSNTQTIEGEQAEPLREQAYPIVEAQFSQLHTAPTLEGIDDLNGKPAYKVKFTVGGSLIYNYYDVASGLKVKSVGTEDGVTNEATFEDYRTTSYGVKHPYVSETTMQGMPVTVKVTAVEIH